MKIMGIRATFISVVVAAAVGAVIAAITPAKWLAATLWVSAAMMINGAVAVFEDARTVHADDAEGLEGNGGAGLLALKCVAASLALAGFGFAVQFLWFPTH